ncbi:MAG TPA: hypothetical protein VKR78_02920 [Acidimicrobiales bacterium]|nr:hypothetical protein [Acidimicrobiales bacterium]
MPAAAICSSCGLRIAAHDQVERRVEYRSVVGLRRLRTWRLALICRRCAFDEWEAHDYPHGRYGTQGSLL